MSITDDGSRALQQDVAADQSEEGLYQVRLWSDVGGKSLTTSANASASASATLVQQHMSPVESTAANNVIADVSEDNNSGATKNQERERKQERKREQKRKWVEEYLQVCETAEIIAQREWTRIGLQLPDSLLPYASILTELLQTACGASKTRYLQEHAKARYESKPEDKTTEVLSSSNAERIGRNNKTSPLCGPMSCSSTPISRKEEEEEEAGGGGGGETPDDHEGQIKRDLASYKKKLKFFVLGDTSYGSCCVDEVAAKHHDAEVIVHYGQACLSKTTSLPVVFVFGKARAEVRNFLEQKLPHFQDSLLQPRGEGEKIVVVSDVRFENYIDEFVKELGNSISSASSALFSQNDCDDGANTIGSDEGTSVGSDTGQAVNKVVRANIPGSDKETGILVREPVTQEASNAAPQHQLFLGRAMPTIKPGDKIVFFGSLTDPQLVQLALRYSLLSHYNSNSESGEQKHEQGRESGCEDSTDMKRVELFVLDPWKARFQSVDDGFTGKILARRMYLIERAKISSIFGILVGTMGVGGYQDILKLLRKRIKQAGRKSYSFVMGKINPQKLANFPEIDMFVLVACPQNSLIDSKEFVKPVITPFELATALEVSESNVIKSSGSSSFPPSKISTDFAEVLANESANTLDENGSQTAFPVQRSTLAEQDRTSLEPSASCKRGERAGISEGKDEDSYGKDGDREEGQQSDQELEDLDDWDAPRFSLVSGSLEAPPDPFNLRSAEGGKSLTSSSGQEASNSDANHQLSLKNQKTHITLAYSSPAGDLLQTRSYRGLEASKGDKPAAKAKMGQTGIASGLRPFHQDAKTDQDEDAKTGEDQDEDRTR